MPFVKGDAVYAYDADGTPHPGTIFEYEPKSQTYRVRHDDDSAGTPLHEYPERKVTKRINRT